MKTLLKSNDQVFICWIKFILSSHKIKFFVIDESMAIQEGSIIAIPIRILVKESDCRRARQIIKLEESKL